MFKKLLLIALLMLPFTALLAPQTANATTAETEASLKAKLVAGRALQDALADNGIRKEYSGIVDIPDAAGHGLVNSGRIWAAADGTTIEVVLFAYMDGSPLTRSDRRQALDGTFADAYVETRFRGTGTLIEDLGALLDSNDNMRAYDVVQEGNVQQALVITFIRGDILGLVVHSAAPVNEGFEAGLLFGMQVRKLS